MSRLCKGLLGVLLSLGLMGGFGASGYASLGQYPHDNRDPATTGCDSGANTPSGSYTVQGDQGYVELRYSPGCTTAWARFTCVHPIYPYNVCFNYMFKVVRGIDGATIVKNVSDGTPVGAHTWTAMVWDYGSIQSQACILKFVIRYYVWACTAWY